jgi:glucoamylase
MGKSRNNAALRFQPDILLQPIYDRGTIVDKGIEKHDVTKPGYVYKARGKPGNKPSWSSGAKTLVGTAASPQSRMWFTVANGTLNEIYFPDVDQANTRSVRFLVSDGASFFSDEQWDASHTVQWAGPGVPGCHIESRCKAGRYTIVKDIITDPVRDTLMMRVSFTTSEPESELKLYLFIEPQMGDRAQTTMRGWVTIRAWKCCSPSVTGPAWRLCLPLRCIRRVVGISASQTGSPHFPNRKSCPKLTWLRRTT